MDNSKLFGNNIKFLRKKANLSQDEMLVHTGISRATWSDYERNNTQPDFTGLLAIADFFKVTIDDLLKVDIENDGQNVHLNEKSDIKKDAVIVHPIVHRTVHPSALNDGISNELKLIIATEPDVQYKKKFIAVPITDIKVAAGTGIYNNDYVEYADHMSLPAQMLKKEGVYLSIRVKGSSMSPTFYDGSYVLIRLLDRSEWEGMTDKYVYVVCDQEGKGYLKRVKNRFKQDFIVLTSDSPDKQSYPNFNLYTSEIHHIWVAVAKLDFKMPNIHDQYYSKLEFLEDKYEELEQRLLRIER